MQQRAASARPARPRVVILGGGFGGIGAARADLPPPSGQLVDDECLVPGQRHPDVDPVGGPRWRDSIYFAITDDDWQASWDLNVMGVVRTTRAALPALYRRG